MIVQASEVGWTLGHLDDLDADFLRFYGRDWSTFDAPRFFSLAARTPAYGGVMTQLVLEANEPDHEEPVSLGELAGDDLIEVG